MREIEQMNKVYLGDAVYAEWDGHGFKLTTEDGYRATNTIVLEPEVYDALVRYVEDFKEYAATLKDANA